MAQQEPWWENDHWFAETKQSDYLTSPTLGTEYSNQRASQASMQRFSTKNQKDCLKNKSFEKKMSAHYYFKEVVFKIQGCENWNMKTKSAEND